GASDADTRVVRARVMLAHALDMQVVAERVTSVEQLRRLRAAGCDLVQGHLLGRPGPADELLTRSTL
ncbi:MAG: EAL domain-containing protein, partial [Ilumatobacteraceae bacterium]